MKNARPISLSEFIELRPLPRDPDQLIPAVSAPYYTGKAKQTLAKYRCLGVGPDWIKLGGRVFYKASALRQWIDSQARSNTVDAA